MYNYVLIGVLYIHSIIIFSQIWQVCIKVYLTEIFVELYMLVKNVLIQSNLVITP